MKDEDTFSRHEPPPTTSDPERGGDSDGHPLPAPPAVPQDAPSPAHPPLLQWQLPLRHHVRLLLVAMVVLVVLAGGYGVFRAVSPPTRQVSSAFQQVHCPFTLGQGLVEGKDVRCGFLAVPEDRSQPKGHTIRLAVAIFKTPNPQPAPDPLLVLGGGPGVPFLATAGPVINANSFAFFAPGRDIILLDQRGAGFSQPSLNCQANETVQACRDRLVKEGINLSAYTTLENAADVHDLVRALGYQQVNLEGDSYGTRLALTVMRLYPADLRSVVLRSVPPAQVNFVADDRAALFQHAFNMLFKGCAAEPSCNASYPHLQTVFYRLVTDLNKKPIMFQSQTGNHSPVRLTGSDLVNWLFSALYHTDLIPQLPGVIFHISHQDYMQLSLLYSQGLYAPMSMGMFYSVMCSEEMAYTTPQALAASVHVMVPELQAGMLASLQGYYRTCQSWNVKPVSAVQKKPVTSSIPTLLMEGEYDPVTPPANGMLAAQTLSRSFFFQFPGLSHDLQSPNQCPTNIENAFLDHPTEKPDLGCISSMSEPDFR